MNSKVTIVMYHYVRDTNKTNFPEIKALSKEKFNEQIDYFKRRYNFIRVDELIAATNAEHELPPNSVLLTFDDGYKDHYDNVYPILAENNIFGCFYPSGRSIDEKIVLDVNKIHFILAAVTDQNILIGEIFNLLDRYRGDYKLQSNDYYYNELKAPNAYDSGDIVFIKHLLQRELPINVRNELLDLLFKKYVTNDETGFASELYMQREHLIEMADNGMHIGNHGYNHYWLSAIDKEEQAGDIEKALNIIDTINGVNTGWTMCYPYGAYNEFTLQILKQSKCKTGFIVGNRIADIKNDHPLILPRVDTNQFI